MKNKVLLFTFCLVLSLFFSCNKNQNTAFEFDNSQPLALAPDVKWALITEPYAAFHKSLNWDSEVTGYGRRGQILQVLSRSEDSDKKDWYRFEEGWLPESCIIVYSNRLKAQSAAANLKDK